MITARLGFRKSPWSLTGATVGEGGEPLSHDLGQVAVHLRSKNRLRFRKLAGK